MTEAVQLTLPWPMPVPPEITVSHDALLVTMAVHCREDCEVFTVMAPLPPDALALADEGLILNDPPG